jgi:GalNAc-alpha-(1->4)-GalNAc-alpha-(1->3)-diNAcBac-PP-undecaprenol alpha-1,4-N-acetyl-D-galactosaminyltransferase
VNRITLVISSLAKGGAERVMSILAGYWAGQGREVTVITFAPREPDFYEIPPEVRRVVLNLRPAQGPVTALASHAVCVSLLRAEIRKARPDVVISFIDITNVLTVLATRGLGISVVVSERRYPRAGALRWVWRLLRAWTYPAAEQVVVQTERGRASLLPRIRKKTTVIPNPVLPPLARNGQLGRGSDSVYELKKPSVVTMGRLCEEKGFDDLLRALALLKDRHPEWHLTILGEGPRRSQLEGLRDQMGLAGRVHLPGQVRDPHQILRQADLFVMSSRYEGFPNALCEAMACGIPVISTDVPTGPREIIREGVDGLLVPAGDVQALATAMARLMKDQAARRRLAARATEVTERFGIELVMGLWENLFTALAPGGRQRANPRASPPAQVRGASLSRQRVPLLFLIRSLETGGAERQLVELVKALDKTRFAITVVTFYDGGALGSGLKNADGVRLLSLHKRGRWDVLPFFYRFWRVVREVRPRIIHAYMGVANELSSLMAWLVGAKAVWGIRASKKDFSHYDWLNRWDFRLGACLSQLADLIIVNSQAGKKDHIAQGYSRRRMVVIPNGIDSERFHPDREAGLRMRGCWGVAKNERLIGLVARLNPLKDHSTFLHAAALLARERLDVRFVCVGEGPAPYKQKLQALAEEEGLGKRLIWAGPCLEMVEVYNAFDVATSSSSFGEGFSNATAEAMACGIPCVVTDVGDSAAVTGGLGQVVPPGAPHEMKAAWERLLDLPEEQRAALSHACRHRIVQEYGVQQLARKTEEAFIHLLGGVD